MWVDQWLVRQAMRFVFWRYGASLRPEMHKWGRIAEEARLRRLIARLASHGRDVQLRDGVQILAPERLQVGNHVGIGYYSIVRAQGGITLHDFVLLGDYVTLTTVGHPIGERYVNNTHRAPIVIHENVWLAAHVIVLSGVTIGENSVIGAGAVVTEDIPANSVAVGVPARVVRQIDSAQQVIIDAQKAELRERRADWTTIP